MPSTLPCPDKASTHAAVTSARSPHQHDYLLLLSHMRSYSSLLAHVLGSCPEVEGYGETLLRYRSRLDLWRLRHRIRRSTGQPLRGRWLLDKVLHNHIRPLDRWLPADRVRALIFIRRPEPTLQSMLHLAQAAGDGVGPHTQQRFCDDYVSRLHRLRQDGERLGDAAFYYDAEALVERPQALLSNITGWLGLAQPLSTHYQVGRRSGENGFGDPLPNIRAGRVLPASASSVQQPAVMHPDILAEAEAAYQRSRSALRLHCHTAAACMLPGMPHLRLAPMAWQPASNAAD